MDNKKLSPQESLDLIQSMVQQAKQKASDNSFYFLFWGWLVFACCLLQFVMKAILHYPQHYLVWWAMPLGGVISGIYSFRQSRTRQVRSFIDDALSSFWISIAIAFFVLAIINVYTTAWQNAFTYYILLYAVGTFVSGQLLRFKPLVIGGLINFVLAAVCARLNYDYQLLAGAAALLVSYIIPGHLLRSRYRNNKN
ncbi:hypothetical protein [Sediminibacterium ginsengisoli]|uniref:Uncharacterized protein n=1 Tax=Sediminibacterium ginsengisoli TaxID=413434 RepID=A0A1T4JXD9_9BACT|nr:hypothetical protein [Sediminibacterium ginsengisoli]SJZ34831.1 hypothetical protein SAMN04488132_101282 [Sediminibacterium ginsengisoli]